MLALWEYFWDPAAWVPKSTVYKPSGNIAAAQRIEGKVGGNQSTIASASALQKVSGKVGN